MKNILILGAGRGQVGLIEAARNCGYNTVVASIPGNYPGFELADEMEYIDILDKQAVLEVAEKHSVEGVASCCIDLPMKAQGYVNDKLGLQGISEKAAQLSVNKDLMKAALIKGGAITPKYRKIYSVEELHNALSELELPVIVKAVDQAGSKGLNVVRSADEAAIAYYKSMEYTQLGYCIVEEFIEGYKIGCNGFVANGEVLFILPCGDITVNKSTIIPVGHYIPLKLEKSVEQEVEKQMKLSIKALDLDNCAVNADLMIKDGKVYIIEITGRMGANALPELTSIYYGTNIYELIARTAMGDFKLEDYSCFTNKQGQACLAGMIISEHSGTLKRIENNIGNEDALKKLTFFTKEGENVRSFTNTSDCIGELIVDGSDYEGCLKTYNDIKSKIKLIIE